MSAAKTPFRFVLSLAASLVVALGAAYSAAAPAPTAPLRIAYSDWPGWVAWQVAIDKGWLKEAGVNATLRVVRLRAVDGRVLRRQGRRGDDDQRRRAGHGRRRRQERDDPHHRLLQRQRHDRRPARNTKACNDLKGKKIGLEVGFVEHLLLLNGLQKAGMKETDVELVNVKTNETPQVLASGQVAAIGAWQPSSGAGDEGGARRAADLHLGAGARTDLRRRRGEPDESREPPRRLGEARDGLGSRGEIHQRSEDPG